MTKTGINLAEPSVPSEFKSVQALRGIAALMVVCYHCMIIWGERIAGYPEQAIRNNMSGGVDLFFVISGFVMVVSSQRLRQRADGWRLFLWRRFIRIAPFYWLITVVRLAMLLAVPHLAIHAFPGATNIICSFLFLPSANPAGEVTPVVADGWTLSFEMLFYLVFAIALWLRAPLLAVLVPVFGVLAGLAIIRTDAWPPVAILANLLVLEFIFGVCVALVILRGFRLPPGPAALLIVAGFALMLSLSTGPTIGAAHSVYRQTLRVLVWGVPATLIVLSACAAEVWLRRFLPGFVLLLGDASYSIYLVHSFVLAAVGGVVAKLHLGSHAAALAVIIILGMAASGVAGILVYKLVEHPLVESLRKRVRQGG